MTDWNKRLYDSYVSTGIAMAPKNIQDFENPYLDKLITDHLPKNSEITILDLGCGYGRLLYCLKKHGYNKILGVDISAEQVSIAHAFGISEVICQDLQTFIKSNGVGSYDVIFLMDIIEHFEKKEILNLLENVYKILNDNGIAFIHIPNGTGIFGMSVRYGDFTHENSFTCQSIKQILMICKFNYVECFEDKPIVHGLRSMIRFILWQLLTIPFRILLVAETGITEHILSQNMLVVAKKTPNRH